EALRRKSGYVEGVVEERRKSKAQVRIVKPTRSLVAEQASLLQCADRGQKRDGVIASAEIQASYVERCQWTHTVRSQRLGLVAGLPGLKLESNAIVEGVTFCFPYLDQHVLARFDSFGVLDRGVHLSEDAEI